MRWTKHTRWEKVHLDSGTLAPLLRRLEKQGLVTRERLDTNERKLYVSLTEAGEALREKALSVPESMRKCIPLPTEELLQLQTLLKKALAGMNDAAEV